MKIPLESDPTWRQLIKEEIKPNIKFLGTKILLGRLCLNYRLSNTEEVLSLGVVELIKFFKSNIKIPKVQEDLIEIFGKEVML